MNAALLAADLKWLQDRAEYERQFEETFRRVSEYEGAVTECAELADACARKAERYERIAAALSGVLS